jgi:hypothetical protein
MLVLLLAMAVSSGRAAVALTLFGVGAETAAGTGVSSTLNSIADTTFTASAEHLRAATLKSLKRMAIEVKENQPMESGRKIVAVAGDRTIEIELDWLTVQTTRMRVTAKHGTFFKDWATATEIIVQTERTLDEEPMPARQETSTAASARTKEQGGSRHAEYLDRVPHVSGHSSGRLGGLGPD